LILLGLDPRDSDTLAVFIDEEGHVLARGRHGSLQEARSATHDGKRPDAVGVVSRDGSHGDGVIAVNPGAAIALAEQWTGVAKGARIVVGITLDTNIHAGIVVDGRLFTGAHGLAGAAGWMALNPVERVDYTKLGCLEAEVGVPGIIRRLVWRIKSGDHSLVQEAAGNDLGAITLDQIFDAARKGDGLAISVVRDTARYIGMAIANLATILDPDVVVAGGTIVDAGDLLLELARTEMSRRVPSRTRDQVPIVPAALGDEAAAVGAARAALVA
jgi:glucokinase